MDITAINDSSDIRCLDRRGNLIRPEGQKGSAMKEFETLKKLLLALIQYYLDNGYYYCQLINYPQKKIDKWQLIDKKLSDKFGLELNKGQRAYKKRKKQANAIGLRYKGICLILHTYGSNEWDEGFINLKERTLTIPTGTVVTIDLSIKDSKGKIKFNKRSYQDLKEIVKDFAKNTSTWKQKNELEKIRHLPAVRRQMHRQKEHLFELYQKECRRHGKKPYTL